MKTIESRPCPNCTNEETLERHPNLSGYWTADSEENVKRCNNCGHEEPYHPRSPRDGNEHGTTESQEKKLDAARRFAEEHSHAEWEMEADHLEWGPMSVKLELDSNDLVRRLSIRFFLTRRGKVELKACDRFTGPSDPMASMFCRATGGHDERARTEA
jgi:hypothetical protein